MTPRILYRRQRRQPQCHARSAALRYQRSAISLPQPPQPRTPSVIPPPPTPPPPPPPVPSFAPTCRPFAPPPPSPGGGVVLPQPTSFSISNRYDACRGILQTFIASPRHAPPTLLERGAYSLINDGNDHAFALHCSQTPRCGFAMENRRP
ncbi:hypothetical protein PUN28_019081 [Cardiocondyla obscurior]|uniref:Uncharacterized protein n=1 Tax=Cardiocondyla obscurior TaxID=286306 RepID=A0AAW2EE60_9HYME